MEQDLRVIPQATYLHHHIVVCLRVVWRVPFAGLGYSIERDAQMETQPLFGSLHFDTYPRCTSCCRTVVAKQMPAFFAHDHDCFFSSTPKLPSNGENTGRTNVGKPENSEKLSGKKNQQLGEAGH